jgi:tetratricopeptide (TPR) repeat protein
MMNRFENNMILYRPVGLQELALIYDSGMKAFPARLPQQPIFYPVLQLAYARQTASGWNAQNGQLAGYVTQFKVEDQYISQFEKHTVGGSQHQELWIPAEELEEFNRHITGHIKVLEAYFEDGFQGFVPETFGLQGKNAVEQFTLLANSYLYKRMDFYLEIRRNHKAIFLNYLFWQKYEFKNQGLKEKVLQTIKEAWLTSFPKIPLPMPPPIHEDTPHVKQTDSHSHSFVNPVEEDITPIEQTDPHAYAQRLVNPDDEDVEPIEPIKQTDPHAQRLVNPVHEDITLVKQTDAHAHFLQGLEFGLSGGYQEAIGELSKAVQEDPDHVVAHTSLGVAFHRLGEDDRGLSCYEAALRIDPIYAEAHYFRANILYSHGNIREAIAGYTIAIGLKPELIEAHQKAVPEDRLTDYSPSPVEMYWIAKPAHRILDLNKSLETNPGQASLFKERAAEYYRLRNYVQAIADYSSSLEMQPDDAGVLHSRGVAYEQIEQFDRALEDYQRASAINPQLSDFYINRGITFGKTGNFRQSIVSFTQAIRLAPKNPDGYFNRGTAYLQQGDFERAIDDFSNVILLSPGDEDAYYWRGISNEEAGRQGDAIADYRQFLALSQDENARVEIEHKLSQWNVGKPDIASSRGAVPDDGPTTNQVASKEPDQELDLYGLIVALGDRALHSTWFGSGVDCYGERADELYAFTDHNRPIEGGDFLDITSGIRQTIAGDFHAFDPAATSHWIFIRAWDGSGFYIEINDSNSKERLKNLFQSVEEVDGASPPYEGLFIRI